MISHIGICGSSGPKKKIIKGHDSDGMTDWSLIFRVWYKTRTYIHVHKQVCRHSCAPVHMYIYTPTVLHMYTCTRFKRKQTKGKMRIRAGNLRILQWPCFLLFKAEVEYRVISATHSLQPEGRSRRQDRRKSSWNLRKFLLRTQREGAMWFSSF